VKNNAVQLRSNKDARSFVATMAVIGFGRTTSVPMMISMDLAIAMRVVMDRNGCMANGLGMGMMATTTADGMN